MENAKYICVVTHDGGAAIFIFPCFISHVDFCTRYFGDEWWQNNAECRGDLLSAGFVAYHISGKLRCIGESSSLKLKSRPEDTDLLHRMLG